MKKLSLFSLLGLAGLLAFVATPIYAQEDEAIVDDANIIAEADDIIDEAEDVVAEVGEDIVAEAENIAADTEEVVDSAIEGAEDVPFLWSEDLENILWELNVDEMSKEDAMATTWVLGGIFGLLAGLGIVGWIIGLILRILKIIALWKAFEKAGEGGWKAIVPIYCSYIKYKLAGIKNWFWYAIIIALIAWIIATCIPDQQELITNIGSLICWILYIVMTFMFARKYGWGVFTSILFVLFYPICILILGFGSSKYQGEKQEKTVVEA